MATLSSSKPHSIFWLREDKGLTFSRDMTSGATHALKAKFCLIDHANTLCTAIEIWKPAPQNNLIKIYFDHSNGNLSNFGVQKDPSQGIHVSWDIRGQVRCDTPPPPLAEADEDILHRVLFQTKHIHINVSMNEKDLEMFSAWTKLHFTFLHIHQYAGILHSGAAIQTSPSLGRYPPIVPYTSYYTITEWGITQLMAMARENHYRHKRSADQSRMKCLLTIPPRSSSHLVYITMGHSSVNTGDIYNPGNGDQVIAHYYENGMGNFGRVRHANNGAIKCDFAVVLKRDSLPEWFIIARARAIATGGSKSVSGFIVPHDPPSHMALYRAMVNDIISSSDTNLRRLPVKTMILNCTPCGPLISTLFPLDLVTKGVYINAVAKLSNRQKAVFNSLLSPNGGPFRRIQGPPGTGKSYFLSVFIDMCARLGMPVLVVAQSNTAVEVLMEKVLNLAVGDYVCVRVNTPYKEDQFNNQLLLDKTLDGQLEINARDRLLMEASLSATACKCANGIASFEPNQDAPYSTSVIQEARSWITLRDQLAAHGNLTDHQWQSYNAGFHRYKQRVYNDAAVTFTTNFMGSGIPTTPWIIVQDEAAQCWELDALLPINAHKKTVKMVVQAGDIHQLSPHVESDCSSNEFVEVLRTSLFARCDMQLNKLLPENWRSRSRLTLMTSNVFYHGKMIAAPGMDEVRPAYEAYLDAAVTHTWFPEGQQPGELLFVNVVNGQSFQDSTYSTYNFGSLSVGCSILVQLVSHPFFREHPGTIMIITPYKGQKHLWERFIALQLQNSTGDSPQWEKIHVSTIDSSQGDDCSIIILDLVVGGGRSALVGFIDKPNRID